MTRLPSSLARVRSWSALSIALLVPTSLLQARCGSEAASTPDGDASSGDSSNNGDASPDSSSVSDAPANTDAPLVVGDAGATDWAYMQVPGTQCGNGSVAGFAHSLVPGSKKTLIYFVGGGACWNTFTCKVADNGKGTAAHINENYTEATFKSELPLLQASGFFDRDANSPFKDANMFVVPYCTGDLHAGDAIQAYNPINNAEKTYHKGGANVDKFIPEFQKLATGSTQIWISGSSAGGYGAQLNFDRLSIAYPGAKTDLLADCAQAVTPVEWGTWQAMWKPTFPATCTDCKTSFPALIPDLAKRYPGSNIGLLDYESDDVLLKFFYGLISDPALIRNATNSLLDNQYTSPNTRYFHLKGTKHVMLGEYKTLTHTSGVTLKQWIGDWSTHAPAWANQRQL